MVGFFGCRDDFVPEQIPVHLDVVECSRFVVLEDNLDGRGMEFFYEERSVDKDGNAVYDSL